MTGNNYYDEIIVKMTNFKSANPYNCRFFLKRIKS